MATALSVIRVRFFIRWGGGETDIRETGTTSSIHKDIFLDKFYQDYVTNRGTERI